MSSHFRLKRYQFWTQGVMSSTTTITSNVIEIINLDDIGIQLNITGTPNGAFDVQVSTDHSEDQEGNILYAGNWISVPLSKSPSVTGSATFIFIDLTQLSASYLRIQYTNSSGSGNVDGFASGKGLM